MANCLHGRQQLQQLLMLQNQAYITIILFFFGIGSTRQILHSNEYWLPENVVPITYSLSLKVNMEKLTTEGRVSILVKVVRPTKQITLHVHPRLVRVKQNEVRVVKMNTGRGVKVKRYKLDKAKEFGIVELANKLKTGTFVKLVIPFKGKVQDESYREGLFLSQDDAGSMMAVTDFEPMSARKVRANLFLSGI